MTREFFDDEHDAYLAMIGSSGKTVKECACHLFPALKPESAYAKLKDKLNPKGSEHLRIGELLALMRYCQSYEPLMQLCDETLHHRPERKQVEVEQLRLVETIGKATDTLARAMQQLEQLQERSSSPIARIRTA